MHVHIVTEFGRDKLPNKIINYYGRLKDIKYWLLR